MEFTIGAGNTTNFTVEVTSHPDTNETLLLYVKAMIPGFEEGAEFREGDEIRLIVRIETARS